ncbi:MCE family protein, partial [Rhodococcus hoagii]|nr:MCE family protein [Prescottella equi]
MMLSKFVKIQLVIFSILTVIGLVVMATQYVRLQDMAGIGRYKVTVELPSTGGLYRNANVTFRGTTVGKVEEVRLSDSGVEAVLNVDSAYDIPANVNADVRSVSAVGEQFVDLVPPEDSSSSNHLRAGDVIPVSRTSVPQ